MAEDKKTKTSSSQKHVNVDAVVLVLLVIVLASLGGFYVLNKKAKPASTPLKVISDSNESVTTAPTAAVAATNAPSVTPKPTLTPTPSPRPIPHGPKNFYVSIGSEMKGPRMGKGTIDPYDPQIGGKQKISIEATDTVPVQKVVATLKTDNKTSEPMTLTLVAGTKSTYSGEWTVNDSYLYTYVLSIQATSASGTSSVDVTLR